MKSFSFTTGRAFDTPRALWEWLVSQELETKLEVTVKVIRDVRSLGQNRRYFSLIVPLVAEVLSASRDIPISKDQAHYLLKASFIGVIETPLGMVPKSSKDLDVGEFLEFTRKVEEWLATAWGLVIPERGEDLDPS